MLLTIAEKNQLIAFAENHLRECEICGSWHPLNYDGDCRSDKMRYKSPEDLANLMESADDLLEFCKRIAEDIHIMVERL